MAHPETRLALESNGTSEQRVPVLERALLIMEHLLQHPGGLGVSDVSNQLEFPKNSVYRILHTLERFGYVDRDSETKRFILSRKLFAMAYSRPEEKTLMENSLDAMRDLRDVVKETVLLSIIADDQGLVLEQAPGLYSFRFVVEPGTRRSLHASSHGKAILAFTPEREREEVLARITLTRFTENTITEKAAFRQELSRIRSRGYAVDHAEEAEGVHCVSSPILDQHGAAVAALTTTGPAFRMPVAEFETLGAAVKEHAERISKRLGYGLV